MSQFPDHKLIAQSLSGQTPRQAQPAAARHGPDPGWCDVAPLAEQSNGFTGAEIEQCVIDALYDAFDAGAELDQARVVTAILQTVPLSRTMADEIKALRQWVTGRARCAGVSGIAGNGGPESPGLSSAMG